MTPDGRNSLRLRGSIRLNGGYDFNGLLGKSTFSTVDIPVTAADTGETSFFMQAAQTRFGIDITQDTPVGEGFLRVEMDFLGAGNTARLRHAYGSVGVLLDFRFANVFQRWPEQFGRGAYGSGPIHLRYERPHAHRGGHRIADR